jgi:hypothetical protein
MLVWGLGPALGALTAWVAFGMLWKMLAGNAASISGFGVGQSRSSFGNPYSSIPPCVTSCRSIPLQRCFAAWAAVTAFDEVDGRGFLSGSGQRYSRAGVATLIGVIMLATLGWAYAFTRIYSRPIRGLKRAGGSIRTCRTYQPTHRRSGCRIQSPTTFPANRVISASESYTVEFRPEVNGGLLEVYLPYISEPSDLRFALQDGHGSVLLASERIQIPQGGKQDKRGVSGTLRLVQPIPLRKGQVYRSVLSSESTSGASSLPAQRLLMRRVGMTDFRFAWTDMTLTGAFSGVI